MVTTYRRGTAFFERVTPATPAARTRVVVTPVVWNDPDFAVAIRYIWDRSSECEQERMRWNWSDGSASGIRYLEAVGVDALH